ncbi:hypothetical protein NKG05_09545 [Oerskovia sp. M15]
MRRLSPGTARRPTLRAAARLWRAAGLWRAARLRRAAGSLRPGPEYPQAPYGAYGAQQTGYYEDPNAKSRLAAACSASSSGASVSTASTWGTPGWES